MNCRLLALLLFFFVAGCNSSTSEETEPVETEQAEPAAPENETGVTIINRPPLWMIEVDSTTQKEKLKKPETPTPAPLSAQDIITELNESYADVQLQLQKISHDTIYVKIPESEVFTHQMGSTGSYNYLAVTVFNLTELPGVKYVNLDFKEGDHAMPGVFSRDNFQNLR